MVKEELEHRYGVSFPDKYRYEPSYYYHAFSLPYVPAVCSGSPGVMKMLKWGLIPAWVRNNEEAGEIRMKTFNARGETLDSKPSFSASFRTKRCLIPVRGFFEWQHTGKEKIPWYIYPARDEMFTLAGLYNDWTDNSSGETVETFSIVTTEANDLMAVIHNSKKRMPVILDRTGEEKWLSMSTAPDEARSLLKPCSSDLLKAHTIGPLVNSRIADRNDPEVIRPYTYLSDNLLF
jgi:putative SOS response-associated peptidase YedK